MLLFLLCGTGATHVPWRSGQLAGAVSLLPSAPGIKLKLLGLAVSILTVEPSLWPKALFLKVLSFSVVESFVCIFRFEVGEADYPT